MKKRLLLGLFTLISLNVWADDPDYNTATGIVTFQRVTVNNNTPYINARLLLDPNGTWSILEAELESESEFDLTGDWRGEAHDPGDVGIPVDHIAITEVSFIQNGNELTGFGSFTPSCSPNNEECVKTGGVIGMINGNNISFGIVLDKDTVINYSGTVSSDQRTLNLTGPNVIDGNHLKVTIWTLSLQD